MELTDVLNALNTNKNVLLAGAPATGKTTLMNLAGDAFCNGCGTAFEPAGNAAFPALGGSKTYSWEKCTNRKVFHTTFHQGTKYRDFVRGLVPKVDGKTTSFRIQDGVLWKAAEFARAKNSAALLIIDEINRGPAASIFGDTISAIEADKRMGSNNEILPGRTVTIQVMNDKGELNDYSLPCNLYILAAMNQADSSVEPLDVAFLRRWQVLQLTPDYALLKRYFGFDFIDYDLPDEPKTSEDVYAAVCLALKAINERIELGRGAEYALGQGILMRIPSENLPKELEGALDYVLTCWAFIKAHVEELFYRDIELVAEIYNSAEGNLFKVDRTFFAGREVLSIRRPPITTQNIYQMLLSIIG